MQKGGRQWCQTLFRSYQAQPQRNVIAGLQPGSIFIIVKNGMNDGSVSSNPAHSEQLLNSLSKVTE